MPGDSSSSEHDTHILLHHVIPGALHILVFVARQLFQADEPGFDLGELLLNVLDHEQNLPDDLIRSQFSLFPLSDNVLQCICAHAHLLHKEQHEIV